MNFWLYEHIDQNNILINRLAQILFKIRAGTDKTTIKYFENSIKLLVRQKNELQKIIKNDIEGLFMEDYAKPDIEYWGKHLPLPDDIIEAIEEEVNFLSMLLACNFIEFSGI